MATHQEIFSFNDPKEVIEEIVKEQLSPYLWNILKDGPEYFLVQEKMIGDKPFHNSTYIGPTQIEVIIR